MNFELTWRGIAKIFIITTVILSIICFFQTVQNNFPKSSHLEKYLKDENNFLVRQNDSIYLELKEKNKSLLEKEKSFSILANSKDKITIVYYEKYKKIDNYIVRQLISEFDSIFAKVGID